MKGLFKDAYADAKRTFLGDKPLTEQSKQAMDTSEDKANGTAEPKPKTRKVKKQVRKGDLPLSSGTASLDQASKDTAAEKENQMFMEDKLVADTEDKKNELESYIYELRAKIDEQYAEFASDQEKTDLKAKLEQSEVRGHIPATLDYYSRILTLPHRTGSTTKAKRPPKTFIKPRSKKSAPSPAPSCSASRIRSKKSASRC